MINEKVSIVLPVYNGAGHIYDSVNSIIRQTYQNWEFIIVYDCSTDNTLEICNALSQQDNRLRVISNEKNLKLPNTLNACFLYTAEVTKKVGRYDANLFLAEDYDYWIRIYR